MKGELKINNKKDMYDSLVQSFEFEVGKGQRKKIAKRAGEMIKELGKKRDPITKEYKQVLLQIQQDYSRKQTQEEIDKEIREAKWAKRKI